MCGGGCHHEVIARGPARVRLHPRLAALVHRRLRAVVAKPAGLLRGVTVVDVCVIGAGPAGAALAARLAALGHDVAIVERLRFPRPHVGESLSAGARPVLDALGVRVEQAGFVETAVARVRWRGDEEERTRVPGGLTVDRGAFDALLLDHARAAGARVLEPGRAQRPFRRGGGWEVALPDRVLRARLVADATGRRRLLGGPSTPTAPRTLALHAICPAPPRDGAQTRIDALEVGWLWGAHLPGAAGFRAMAFVDPSALRAVRGDRTRLLRRLLSASPLFAELAPGVIGPVVACDATCYAARTSIDTTQVRVGEAAFAIDPLSSSGVQTAIGTGIAAAAAVHTLLADDGDAEAAVEYYAAYQRHAVRRHAATAAAIYSEHRKYRDAPFWRLRSGESATADAPPPAARLADLLPRPVCLATGAALEHTPCVVDDRVQRRRALTHPDLERPVAFLGGAELAPLLDQMPEAPSLAHTIKRWDAVLPPGRGRAIAEWLHARDLLESQPARTRVTSGIIT